MPVSILDYPSSLPTGRQTLAAAIPTTPGEDVQTEDVYLECAVFNVSGSTAVDVTLTDKQGSPVEILRLAVDPKFPAIINPARRILFKGGLTWVASAAGINGYLVLSK